MILARLITPEASYWTGVFPAILVMAAGMTIAVAPLTASVLGSVEERHVAMASGLNSAVARLGGLIATALLGSVLGRKGGALFSGFHAAMVVSAAIAVGAGVVALTMLGKLRHKNTQKP
jgi:predicted MFS family arabinose efflux permease